MSSDPTLNSSGDGFNAYLSAYLQGRELARRRRRQGALAALPASFGESEAGRPSTAGDITSDPHVVHLPAHDLIGRLPSSVQGAVRDHADILSAFAQGLLHYPYRERLAILRHAAPHLARLGFTSKELSSFDPTDQNIEEVRQAAAHVLARPKSE